MTHTAHRGRSPFDLTLHLAPVHKRMILATCRHHAPVSSSVRVWSGTCMIGDLLLAVAVSQAPCPERINEMHFSHPPANRKPVAMGKI